MTRNFQTAAADRAFKLKNFSNLYKPSNPRKLTNFFKLFKLIDFFKPCGGLLLHTPSATFFIFSSPVLATSSGS